MAKTVLIVDDDPFILRAVETYLKIKGLKVISCNDPGQAFKAAEDKHPDLIISDVAMPGIDGFTLLQSLKSNKNTQKIPFILLTATDRITDVEKGFAAGAQAYVLKPIEWERAWIKIQPFVS